ncbi:MAG: DUF1178 family protein [Dongiaceae bacterium]
MILFDLKCAMDHVFEGWFHDGDAYEAQAAAGEIACPVCGDRAVGKAPMAPRILGHDPRTKGGGDGHEARAEAATALRALRELRDKVEATSDYVGPRFPEEARRIHYGETEKRNIYGEASNDEARELHDEGVEFARIPWLPRHDS